MDKVFHIYRKTIERISIPGGKEVVMKDRNGVEHKFNINSLSDAYDAGREFFGPTLVRFEDYPDRYLRSRMKVIRKEVDPDKE